MTEVKKVFGLVCEAPLDQVSLLTQNVVEGVLIRVVLDLVIKIDKFLKGYLRSDLVVLVLEALIAHTYGTFNFI